MTRRESVMVVLGVAFAALFIYADWQLWGLFIRHHCGG